MDGAKDEGLDTIVFCQKGRETPYQRLDRIADEIKILKKFSEMSSTKNQKMLRDTNTIIIPHRSLTAYLGYNVIENSLKVQYLVIEHYFRLRSVTIKKINTIC